MALVEHDRYLDLLARCLTGILREDPPIDPWHGVVKRTVGGVVLSPGAYDPEVRICGKDWPETAETMVGWTRLRVMGLLIERAVKAGVPGDVLEAGVWRGGCVIYMRAVLDVLNQYSRVVFAADSFCGLPKPEHAEDVGDLHHAMLPLVVSQDEVKRNIARYSVIDGISFLAGFFKDTLPIAPVSRLCILRLDGDMYGSTMDVLVPLYDKLSPGGYCVIDDYNLPPVRAAIRDFFTHRGEPVPNVTVIDHAGAFWRK